MTTEQQKLNNLLFQTIELNYLNGDCRSCTDRVAKLILQGANPLATNDKGITAIEAAVEHERLSALKVMLRLMNDAGRHSAQQPGGLNKLIDGVYASNGYVIKRD